MYEVDDLRFDMYYQWMISNLEKLDTAYFLITSCIVITIIYIYARRLGDHCSDLPCMLALITCYILVINYIF